MPFTAKETCCRVWMVLDYCCFFAVGSLDFVRLHVWVAAVAQHQKPLLAITSSWIHVVYCSTSFILCIYTEGVVHFGLICVRWLLGNNLKCRIESSAAVTNQFLKKMLLFSMMDAFAFNTAHFPWSGKQHKCILSAKKKIVPMESCCRTDTLQWLFLALSCVDESCGVDLCFVCP